LDIDPMQRAELTEKILDNKREKGWTWKHITHEIGGMSPVLVVGALLGQMKLPKTLAEKAGSLFGLSESEKRMLNEIPTRGTPMPPTDPLLYRFYEMVMVNGPAQKALIEEEFGDGIMSAIDFDLERLANPKGDRVGDAKASFAVQILWRRRLDTGSRRSEQRAG
jgi:cyanate lyase